MIPVLNELSEIAFVVLKQNRFDRLDHRKDFSRVNTWILSQKLDQILHLSTFAIYGSYGLLIFTLNNDILREWLC